MRKTATLAALALTITSLAAACDPGEGGDAELRVLTDNSAAINGIILNGIILNGIILNGIILNGIILNGGEVDGVTISASQAPDGDAIKSVWIDKTSGALKIKTVTNKVFAGAEVAGTSLTYSSPGGDYRLWLDEAVDVGDEEFKGGGLLHYTILYQVKSGEVWGEPEPLCFDGEGEPTEALLLPGSWDHETGARTSLSSKTITIACRHAALAKCAEWGYRPGVMPNTHQTCLRMTRADYAGDGVPHTANGTEIYVRDVYGVNVQKNEPGLTKEAEWGPHGALCLHRAALRHPELTGCEDPEDPETCFPGIPECWGSPHNLKAYFTWWGARIVTAVEIDG